MTNTLKQNHEMMKEQIESFGFKVIFLRLAPFKRGRHDLEHDFSFRP